MYTQGDQDEDFTTAPAPLPGTKINSPPPPQSPGLASALQLAQLLRSPGQAPAGHTTAGGAIFGGLGDALGGLGAKGAINAAGKLPGALSLLGMFGF